MSKRTAAATIPPTISIKSIAPVPPPVDLGAKLNRLALSIIDDLLRPDVPLDQRIDGLKAVTTLHLGTIKLSDKMPRDDDRDGTTFGAMRDRLTAIDGSA